MNTETIDRLARQLSADSIRSTTQAGSGHPTSAMSAAHLFAALLTRHLRYRIDEPDYAGNDRLVLSKGHAAPLLYAAISAMGLIDGDLLPDLRKAGSPLEGHPVPGVPFVDVATGSLGQGLANGLGMALGLRHVGSPARVWVLLGDSEMSEGSVWEAMALAAHHGVSNLIAIVDMNRLGQRGPTMYGWDAELYMNRARSFGWEAITVDGHDPASIDRGLATAAASPRPSMLVATTVKGYGVSFLADAEGRHGKPLDEEEAQRALSELATDGHMSITPRQVPDFDPPALVPREWQRPRFTEPVATRDAFGAALAAATAADPGLIVLDGEVADSTRTAMAAEEAPGRFIQMYIAEQAMVGAATGLDAVGLRPVAATFAAFLTRAHDFIRMAAIGRANMLLCGSHAGVSIGEDGPSQMGLEDIAMMRATPGATVLYPADGTATAALVELALRTHGLRYVRTTREATPVLYGGDAEFTVGGSHTLRSSIGDAATVVAAGVTVFEALRAADELADRGHTVRVIDAYSVEPIDAAAMNSAMADTKRIVVVEDHVAAGGLGDAVLGSIAGSGAGRCLKLAVEDYPGSATPAEQRRRAGISSESIVSAVEALLV
jgi:transketolase